MFKNSGKIKSHYIIDFCILIFVISSALFFIYTRTELQAQKSSQTLLANDNVPSITFIDTSGTQINFARESGRFFLVFFGLCPTCFEEILFWNELESILGNRINSIRIYGVWIHEFDAYIQFTMRQPVRIPTLFIPDYVYKEDVLSEFRIRRLGQAYYIENGNILEVYLEPSKSKTKDDIKSILDKLKDDAQHSNQLD